MADFPQAVAVPSNYHASQLPVGHPVQYVGGPPVKRNEGCCGCSKALACFIGLLFVAGAGVGIYFAVTRLPALIAAAGGTNNNGAPTLAPSCGATCSPTRPPNIAFNIELSFTPTVSETHKTLFNNAKNRWEQVMNTDMVTPTLFPATSYCGGEFTLLSAKTIDDILIFVDVSPIDGVGTILGQAGPCATTGSNPPYVRVGQMQFDSADIDDMVDKGTANRVILHEMGHVFGIGTLWDDFGYITPGANQPTSSPAATSLKYTGTAGNAGHVAVGGSGQAIVESGFGAGTARGHWSEAIYQKEIMTGFIGENDNTNPISKMTIGAIQDLGYTVDDTQFETYTVSGRRLRSTERGIRLGDDIMKVPIVHYTISDDNVATPSEVTTP